MVQEASSHNSTLDQFSPNHEDPPPIDKELNKVAPVTIRKQGEVGGTTPLPRNYWFVRGKYQLSRFQDPTNRKYEISNRNSQDLRAS